MLVDELEFEDIKSQVKVKDTHKIKKKKKKKKNQIGINVWG